MKDEILQEVWKAKDAIAARYDHDVKRLVQHLRAEEKSAGCRVVDLHARRHSNSGAASAVDSEVIDRSS